MIKIKDELEFHNWFKKNYRKVGFEKIKSYNKKFPDFIVIKNKKEIRVELETLSSNFILHKHNPKNVDLVICIKKDANLTVPIMLIKNIRLTDFRDRNSIYSFIDRVWKLFLKNRILTTSEVANKLNINWNTAEKYLLELALESKIEKIKKLGVNLWMAKIN